MPPFPRRVLFISNGHGEDLNASLVLDALRRRDASIEVAALPLVGNGDMYRRRGVTIIARTASLPSGGLIYMDWRQLAADLRAGLLRLTWQQLRAVWQHRRACTLAVAVGDQVPLVFAALTGRPYCALLCATSSHYEDRVRLPAGMWRLLASPRCRQVFTKDAPTAADLQALGLDKVVFAGYPVMDAVAPAGVDLKLVSGVPMVALLPGSRVPEAVRNLSLQLRVCQLLAEQASPTQFQFRAAIPPQIDTRVLQAVAADQGWRHDGCGQLVNIAMPALSVHARSDAFADILHACTVVIGMAGTAVEQAVGLGKPVIQIAGTGPQFTYRFAEAQQRLLGSAVRTVGTGPAGPGELEEAARELIRVVNDAAYLDECRRKGPARVGSAGGSAAIADLVYRCVS